MMAFKKKPVFQTLNINDLKLAKYQRKLDERRVRSYVRDYDPDLFGIILVSFRDGSYFVIDGQHRVSVAKLRGDKTVLCQVIKGLSYEEEAEKFHKVNDRKVRLNANNKFHAKVEARNQAALDIVYALGRYGFTYSPEGGTAQDNVVIPVGAVQKMYNRYGYEGLCKVLDIVKRAWMGNKDSLRRDILVGVNTFIINYTYDRELLVKVLSAVNPRLLINKSMSNMEGNKRIDNGNCFVIAKTIRDMYEEAAIKSNGKYNMCSVKQTQR